MAALHESRVEAERPEECWLEKWSQAAKQRDVRALEQLREGVETAIKALGRGFLAWPEIVISVSVCGAASS